MKRTRFAIFALMLTAILLSSCKNCESQGESQVEVEVNDYDFNPTISFSSKDLYGASSPKLRFSSAQTKKDEERIAKDKVSEQWIRDCLRDPGRSIYALDNRR